MWMSTLVFITTSHVETCVAVVGPVISIKVVAQRCGIGSPRALEAIGDDRTNIVAPVVTHLRVTEHGGRAVELVNSVSCERAGEEVGIAQLEAEIRACEHLLDCFAVGESLRRGVLAVACASCE